MGEVFQPTMELLYQLSYIGNKLINLFLNFVFP